MGHLETKNGYQANENGACLHSAFCILLGDFFGALRYAITHWLPRPWWRMLEVVQLQKGIFFFYTVFPWWRLQFVFQRRKVKIGKREEGKTKEGKGSENVWEKPSDGRFIPSMWAMCERALTELNLAPVRSLLSFALQAFPWDHDRQRRRNAIFTTHIPFSPFPLFGHNNTGRHARYVMPLSFERGSIGHWRKSSLSLL